MQIRWLPPLLACLLLSIPSVACAQTSSLKRVQPGELPQTLLDGELAGFRLALERQIANCLEQDLTETWDFGGRLVTRQKWCIDTARKFLELAQQATDFGALMNQARGQFEWYRSVGDAATGDVKFTGYYFPHLEGSALPDATFNYPLYSRPVDLAEATVDGRSTWRRKLQDGTLIPYFTREEIDLGHALQGQGLEIAWVESPLDAFIFQVQGAGAIQIHGTDAPPHRAILNYAAGNGHPYVSLRRILAAHGVPAEFLTLQGMHVYFKLHPEKLLPSLAQSPAYVFFQESSEGPYGVSNLLLTPGHSIAIDRTALPLGAVALIQTERPVAPLPGVAGQPAPATTWIPFARLALSQDVGGAIRTPGRVDVYWGEDDYAEFAAGQMNQSGSLFFALLP